MANISSNQSGKPLRVGVIGCGRMGRLHARVYSQMQSVKLTGVFDVQEESAAAVADEFAAPMRKSLEELLPEVDAVTIAVPTKFHLSIAQECLRRKIACLIEKPLAKDVAEARRIVRIVAGKQDHGAGGAYRAV